MPKKIDATMFRNYNRDLMRLYYKSYFKNLNNKEKLQIRELQKTLDFNAGEAYPVVTLSKMNVIDLVARKVKEEDLENEFDIIEQRQKDYNKKERHLAMLYKEYRNNKPLRLEIEVDKKETKEKIVIDKIFIFDEDRAITSLNSLLSQALKEREQSDKINLICFPELAKWSLIE
jgi:hypothetical protein